ncbi:MAG: clostripain-related cysteine peptidase [Bacteroides sp.]
MSRRTCSQLWLMALLALLLTACSSSSSGGSEEPILPEDEVAECTVMIYMVADNNLSPYALDDLEEMKVGMAKVRKSNVHLLVYIDTNSTPRLVELLNKNGTVTERVIKTYEKRNSCGVAEMQEVMDDLNGNKSLIAKKYGFIFWSHGEGWIPYSSQVSTRWIGQDTHPGTHYMEIDDLVAFYSNYPKMEFVLFDACFMLSMEVAYALRDQVNYVIGSPTETPGPGADYAELVPAIMEGGDNMAIQIAKAFYEPYEAAYYGGLTNSSVSWTAGVSIGAIKTEGLSQLASLTKQLLAHVTEVPADLQKTVFNYDKRELSGSFLFVGYYDTVELMQQLLPSDDFTRWKAAYDAVLPYWKTTPMNCSSYVDLFSMERANGITHYIPRSDRTKAAESYRQTDWYKDAGLSQLGW